MADSSQRRDALQIFLQRQCAKRVRNTLFEAMPTLDFMFGLNGHKRDSVGLGRVEAGNLAIGRVNGVSRPMREKMFAAREYLPLIKITKPSKSDAKTMGDYDNNPVVPLWGTTNAPLSRFVQPRFKFHRVKMPYKVPHSEVRTAQANGTTEGQAASAIGSVYDAEVKDREAVLCELLNDRLFGINGETGAPANEDAVTWSSFHSLQNALGTTNVYGGVDRSLAANEWWRSNRYTTSFTGSFVDMIQYSNYDFGLIKKGLGVQLIVVGKVLMKRALAEAKQNSYQLISNSIPDPEYGFKREAVCIHSGNRRVFVVYDPAVDAVDAAATTYHAFGLDPSTWTVAIPADRNFKVTKPIDATKVAENGDEADFGNIEAEILIACEVPSANVLFTNVAA